MSEWVLRGARVVFPDGTRPATVHVRGERIERIGAFEDVPDGATVVDAGALTVLPGVVDTHVHVNEPGRTEWEGFRSVTRAAAQGGVTTLFDMPLNSLPSTTSVAALDQKRRAADGKLSIDVGFTGGVVPGNAGELRAMAKEGVRAFKAFLCDSGVAEFPHVAAGDLETALPTLADAGATFFAHAELPGPLEAAERAFGPATASDLQKHATWLRSRPRAAEDEAIALLFALCRSTGARTHVVHLSSSDALPILKAARDQGVPLSAETCPHYLHFDAEHIPDGATLHKCAPPIREKENRDALWAGLEAGLIRMVVSDHSPCTPELKVLELGDFVKAWGGISSLGLGLSIVWTHAQKLGIPLERVVEWMCAAPAALVGLTGRKGSLVPGADADFVLFDPDAEWRVVTEKLYKNAVSPYVGTALRGKVRATYLRGERVYDGDAVTERPTGRMI